MVESMRGCNYEAEQEKRAGGAFQEHKTAVSDIMRQYKGTGWGNTLFCSGYFQGAVYSWIFRSEPS